LTCSSISKDQQYLITGDSGGYFKIWDISSLKPKKSTPDSFKELVYIKACNNELSCIDFVEMDGKKFVVTGSTDKNLYLFTFEGAQVGVFGRILWKIREPKSFWKKKPRLGTPVQRRIVDSYLLDTRNSQISFYQSKKGGRMEEIYGRSSSPTKSFQR
jgi:WD40 repeat protein